MSISITINADHVEHLHAKLKGILYGLAQEPAAWTPPGNGAAQQGSPSILDATKGPPKMTKKQEAALKAVAESVAEKTPQEVQAARDEAAHAAIAAGAEGEIPTIEVLRKSLMSLAQADGHGEDAVFLLLGEYKAKNASTVPEDKRAAVIAAVNAKLAA